MKNRKYFLLDDFKQTLVPLESTVALWLDTLSSTQAQKVARQLVLKHQYDAVLYIDWNTVYESEPTTPGVTSNLYLEMINKFRSIYETTKDKYGTLLDAYDNQRTHLMDKVEAKQKTRFNDTPQAGVTGLDADDYASTYTVQESEVGFEIIERLAKVQTLFMNVLNEWCKEFSNLFMKV